MSIKTKMVVDHCNRDYQEQIDILEKEIERLRDRIDKIGSFVDDHAHKGIFGKGRPYSIEYGYHGYF